MDNRFTRTMVVKITYVCVCTCGKMFDDDFITNLLPHFKAKDFENKSAIGRISGR